MLTHCRKNNVYTSDHHSFYYRRQQAIVYNFLERPHGLAAASYHIAVCVCGMHEMASLIQIDHGAILFDAVRVRDHRRI
jgi:hypothetical protein